MPYSHISKCIPNRKIYSNRLRCTWLKIMMHLQYVQFSSSCASRYKNQWRWAQLFLRKWEYKKIGWKGNQDLRLQTLFVWNTMYFICLSLPPDTWVTWQDPHFCYKGKRCWEVKHTANGKEHNLNKGTIFMEMLSDECKVMIVWFIVITIQSWREPNM